MGIADRDYMRAPHRSAPPDEDPSDEPGGRSTGPFRILLAVIGLILLVVFLAVVFGVR
jgi:hypothetical protein